MKWVRRGAAMMDAVLDIVYTSTYLIITLLAIHELQLDQAIRGNFGDEASVNFQAELDPAFAFPSDFFGFFAVYYSLAHVCTVCRALERSDRLDILEEVAKLTELCFPVTAEPIEIFLLKEISDVLQSLAFLLHWFRYVSFYVVSAIFNPSWFRNLLDLLTQFVM